MKIAVLRNPFSTGNLNRPAPCYPEGVCVAETDAQITIADAVQRIVHENPDLLLIDGGDGTITTAISALIAQNQGVPPLGFIARGNTNLIARKTGGTVRPDDIPDLTARPQESLQHHLQQMPVLDIMIGAGKTRHGFIVGWGAYTQATKTAIEELGTRHDLQVVAAIFATLRRTLFGAEAQALRRGINCRFVADDQELAPDEKRFIGVVTCFQGRLAAGVKPFRDRGNGPLRWLDITAPPRFPLLFAPFVLSGVPLPYLERSGYRSARAQHLSATLSDDMIIDGEVISIAPDTRVEITAQRTIKIFQA